MLTSEDQEKIITLAVRRAGLKVEEVYKKLDISKTAYYNNIKRVPVDEIFLENLKKMGIDVNFSEQEVFEGPPDSGCSKQCEQEKKALVDKILTLQNKVIELHERIDHLEEQLKNK